MIFQYCTTQALHSLYRRYQHRTMWIVTNVPDQVYPVIRDFTHHGATLFQGTGLYRNEPRSMIYTVVAGDEIRRLTHEIRNVDPHDFINAQHTDTHTRATRTDTVTDATKKDTQTVKAYTDTERHTKYIIISPEKYYAIEKELADIGVYDLMKDAVRETMLLCVWEGGYIW